MIEVFLILVGILLTINSCCTSQDFVEKLHRIQYENMYQKPEISLWNKRTFKKISYQHDEKRFVINKLDIFDLKNINKEHHATRVDQSTPRRRVRREQYTRYKISGEFLSKLPFSAVVRVSDRCSGVLIWNQHVLTSAHCVHNHSDLIEPLNKLKVGFLNPDGSFTWLGVSKVFVPSQWKKSNDRIKYINHDYAVIKLDRPHSRKWMKFGAYQNKLPIFFTGFPADKGKDQMWYSACHVNSVLKHVLVNKCSATPGMSGSGVYVYNEEKKADRKIVGVLSWNFESSYGKSNLAVKLTPKKVKKICKWLNAGSNCYKIKLSEHF